MSVLVAAASKHGATHELAEAIADVLAAEGLDVELRRLEEVSTAYPYDAFVLGSAVYMGGWLSDGRTFVDVHADVLATRPTWLFSSGPIGGTPSEPFDDSSLLAATHAREHRVFGGRLAKRRLGLGERVLANVLRAHDGDFRDWGEVAEWAEAVARSLQRQPMA